MASSEEKNRRITAAKELGGIIHSASDVRDDDHRHAMTHDQIAESVKEICCNGNGKNHFTAAQIECLTEIGFRIAFIMDPKNKPKTGMRARVAQGWREASLVEKSAIVLGIPGAAVALVTLSVWLAPLLTTYRSTSEATEASTVAPAPLLDGSVGAARDASTLAEPSPTPSH